MKKTIDISLPKVLIIDDNEDVAECIADLIEADFDSVVVTEGRNVADILEKDSFDIIITDLKMPRISGTELIKQIMIIKPGSKILLCTGHDKSDQRVQEALDLGAIDVLSKPFSEDEILKILKSSLQITSPAPVRLS